MGEFEIEIFKQCTASLERLTAIAKVLKIDCKKFAGTIEPLKMRDFAYELALCPDDNAVTRMMKRHNQAVCGILLLGRSINAMIERGECTFSERPSEGLCPHFYFATGIIAFFDHIKK